MSSCLETIVNKIEVENPTHAAKIRKNINGLDVNILQKANLFYKKYFSYLEKESKTPDFGVECYLHMINDITEERIEFIRKGKYSSSSFNEVEKRVYANPAIMTYYMHGLLLAQFLWVDQFQRFSFFSQNLKKHIINSNKYLEIGGGHGLYLNEAITLLPDMKQFDLVDISQSSIDLAKGILCNNKINYYLKDIFNFIKNEPDYDFITVGEVLEHLENPLCLLKKIVELLGVNGICYITTAINAPMIDHIYLFNNEEEIRKLFNLAGLEILEEKIAISDNKSATYAQKNKSPVTYAAFVKLKQ
jgi:2-polyprenyl-3-methyl-5-hydroxy-6-metoxy-1,4-benzoquinol methylase